MFHDLKSKPFGNIYKYNYFFAATLIAFLCYFFIDKQLSIYCNWLDKNSNFSFVILAVGSLVQVVCDGKFLLPALVASLFFLNRDSRAFKILVLMILLLLSLNFFLFFLKIIFARARPELLLNHGKYGFKFFSLQHAYHSFPSGHTFNITTLAVIAMVFFPRYKKLWFIIGVVAVLSRVIYLKHYLSDVIFSVYLVLILLPISYAIMEAISDYIPKLKPYLFILTTEWRPV